MVDRDRFNRRIDELVARAIAQDPVSPEFRNEYIKLANSCRQVAEYDPELASQLWLSAEMLGFRDSTCLERRQLSGSRQKPDDARAIREGTMTEEFPRPGRGREALAEWFRPLRSRCPSPR